MVDYVTRLITSVANSRIVRWFTASNTYRTASAIGRAPQHARVTRLLRVVVRWTRASYLFRWLTREPDPRVIDLRKTYTVGPFIVMLDWIVAALEPAYRHSRLRAAGAQIARVGAWFAATRPGRLIAVAQEPPEPAGQGPAARDDVPTDDDETTLERDDDGFLFPER